MISKHLKERLEGIFPRVTDWQTRISAQSLRASKPAYLIEISASTLEHAPLQAVYIYIDTATYDEIERDEKVTFLTAFGCVFDIIFN